MYVHYFLKLVEEQQKTPEDSTDQGSGLFSNIKHYFLGGSGKKFYYRIGQFDFTLEEIKHGLLRSNKKAPDAYLCSLSSSDDRLSIIPLKSFQHVTHPVCQLARFRFAKSTGSNRRCT
jgi:hypothetical protein